MIKVIDRLTNQVELEKVYGKKALAFLYSGNLLSHLFLCLFARFKFLSIVYGYFQKKESSKKKILPFIEKFNINAEEFEKNVNKFSSFNDFFIRKLKKEKRPISPGDDVVILPADARYLVFQNIKEIDDFYVKHQKFNLEAFLQDKSLVEKYSSGSMAIARLCPTDYHRFHFPIDCFAKTPILINGYLYSVNPVAIKKNIKIFSQNKRVVTLLETKFFGDILFIEVGATNVGSINQTFTPKSEYKKGDEKGYFSLGGSGVILLFEKNKIKFDDDLMKNSEKKIETKALFGQSLGKIIS